MQERILTKAHELFMRLGIRSVSMDEMATQLGISKKTIYQYYADKDALVHDVIGIEINRNEKECTLQKQSSENAIHEIFLTVDMLEEMLTKMNPSVLFELEKYHPKAFTKFTEHKNKFIYKAIKANLESGIAEELYRPEINVELLTRFRIVSTFLVLNPELFPTTKFNLHELINEITDNFLYGLATTKGIKLIQKYKLQRNKK